MPRASRAGPSQTQSQSQRPTQTQRRASRGQPQTQNAEEDEDEDQEPQEEDEDMEGGGDNAIVSKANDLVRLALFVEQKRTVLRRDEINKKVLGQTTRAFNRVFASAQQKLRDAFGMELVELPSRAGLEQDGGDGATQGTQPTTGIKKKAAASGSKTYMVRSCLDPVIIEHAAQSNQQILEEEGGDQGTLFPSTLEDDAEEDDESPPKFHGSLISWTRGDQLGNIGVLYVILALVLVNGRVMPDGELRKHLKALRLPNHPNAQPIKLSSTSTVRSMNVDSFLSNLLKSSYLDRQQVGGDARKKKGAGSKRLRTQAEDLEEGISYEWRWGPRAHCEVGEENIAQFVAEFMVETEDLDEGVGRRRKEDLTKKMHSGIEKAAGGKLAEIKAL